MEVNGFKLLHPLLTLDHRRRYKWLRPISAVAEQPLLLQLLASLFCSSARSSHLYPSLDLPDVNRHLGVRFLSAAQAPQTSSMPRCKTMSLTPSSPIPLRLRWPINEAEFLQAAITDEDIEANPTRASLARKRNGGTDLELANFNNQRRHLESLIVDWITDAKHLPGRG